MRYATSFACAAALCGWAVAPAWAQSESSASDADPAVVQPLPDDLLAPDGSTAEARKIESHDDLEDVVREEAEEAAEAAVDRKIDEERLADRRQRVRDPNYRWHNNHWWYWTDDGWVFWFDNRWVPFDRATYYSYYPRGWYRSGGYRDGDVWYGSGYRGPYYGYYRSVPRYGYYRDPYGYYRSPYYGYRYGYRYGTPYYYRTPGGTIGGAIGGPAGARIGRAIERAID